MTTKILYFKWKTKSFSRKKINKKLKLIIWIWILKENIFLILEDKLQVESRFNNLFKLMPIFWC